ncbi:MAG: uroporphyrinogen-III C-methyltransferase [Myxococcota bacterium]|nr:uroporphyrinogen-III C-methyltransferase [Myxococcota bacterium]
MTGPVRGRVILVGAGPGDPDLITVRGAAALGRADVVVFDSLAADDLLELARSDAERIDVGKRGHDAPTRSQEDINALLIDRARAGATVVRLKGGDPFVYGRGGEEAGACRAAGVPFEVVPGVSAAIAAAAAAGIPVTDRRHAASFAVVTGHRDATRPWTTIRWDRMANAADTLVVLMGMRNLEKITDALISEGRDPETPAAVVMNGATPQQRVLEAPLAELPARAREAGLSAPAVVVVGDVVRLRRELAWYDRGPLFGKRVLVTRAAERADELCAALREAGAEPVRVPLIRVVACEDGDAPGALERAAGYDALLLTSANAARFLARRLRPETAPRALCVGPATARAAREVGFPQVGAPERAGDADALFDWIARALPPAGRRFLFARAERARETLPQRLREAGARVDEIAIYRTEPAEVDEAALRELLVAGCLDALSFASPSAARRFAACLDPAARAAARSCTIAAIGRVTADALRELQLPADVVPPEPGLRALVAALADAYGARS